jgi:hypothetical protein
VGLATTDQLEIVPNFPANRASQRLLAQLTKPFVNRSNDLRRVGDHHSRPEAAEPILVVRFHNGSDGHTGVGWFHGRSLLWCGSEMSPLIANIKYMSLITTLRALL